MSDVILVRVDRESARHTAHPRHCAPPLDLKYLQAALATTTGETPPLIDGWLTPFSVAQTAATILARRSRYAVIRAVTWNLDESIRLGRTLRHAGVVTIAVGQQVEHVTKAGYDGWHEAYDLAVGGEPEEEVPRLLGRLLAGEPLERLQAEQAGFSTALVWDPEALPRPRFSVDELADYAFPFPTPGRPARRWGYLLTAWGCPRPCRHCTLIVRKSAGRRLRTRPVEQVVDEVAALRDVGAEAIAFEDDSLLVHRSRFLELAEALCRRNLTLPWMANARPDELDDERIAAARESGATLIKLGIDSGSPHMIETIGKAADGEAWVAAAASGSAALHRAGIATVAMFTLGLPGETEEHAQATQALIRRLRSAYLQVHLYRPYPDVDLWDDLPDAQRIRGADYHYIVAPSQCSAISAARIAALHGRMYREFYLRPGYVARHLTSFWRYYLSPHGGGRLLARLPSVMRYLVQR
ncbi:B12-binding domain-containing radical SAM protein [Halomonas alkalisoli]|uniref:B12-binding domain-containing radical SAM protein n=1 Tax=Halomonas alkalisoli TaxID=2907158 RepID=UPI001F3250E8|nr:radical SAM protein [Halomonas alkalisoli]MCE9682597.1 radical SAM protein [Halomonas alkalisoli]